jgi:DNA-binding MarR family transcriptional regulator
MELPAAGDLLAQPTRARLYALLEQVGPAGTAELAEAVDRHPNGVRAHLELMHAAGIVTRSRAAPPLGRPRQMWAVAPGPTAPEEATSAQSLETRGAPRATDADYERLAQLRAGLRRYLAWAEERAREHGLTPAQVQLALAVRTHADAQGPTLTELADTLLLRHHSVVGLVDRAESAGLVRRRRDTRQQSRVHVTLTPHGAERLDAISDLHLRQLAELAPQMQELWGAFGQRHRR